MSDQKTPAYLVNSKTGTIQAYTAALASRPDMVEAMDIEEAKTFARKRGNDVDTRPPPVSGVQPGTDEPQNPTAKESATDPDGTFVISRANKAELREFAQEQFGVKLNSRDSLENMREQVRLLADEHDQAAVLDIDAADKDALEAYAQKHFDVDLDKRHSVEDLREQVRKLQAAE